MSLEMPARPARRAAERSADQTQATDAAGVHV